MHKLRNSFFIFATLLSSFIYGMESGSSSTTIPTPKNIVISFDLDDVVSRLQSLDTKTQVSDLMSTSLLIRELLSKHETAMDWHTQVFNKTEADLAEKNKVTVYYPIMGMIAYIRQLKAQGYTVIASTNQREVNHSGQYRTHMNRYSINFNELFDAVLTTKSEYNDEYDESTLYRRLNQSDNIYVMCSEEYKKPHERYYEAVQEIAQRYNPTVEKVIHIDDRKENVKGASKRKGLVGVRFKPAKIVSAGPGELETSIANLKNELKSHGVSLE